jgi:hypothetical protein
MPLIQFGKAYETPIASTNASEEKLDAFASLLLGLVAGPGMSKKAIKIAMQVALKAIS